MRQLRIIREISMRAAVLTAVHKPLEILDLKQDPPKAGEVRVKVKAAGVCMSDWHIMIGDWPMPLPMVLGHEAAGEVVEIGAGVQSTKVGDHVIFSFRENCGHCRFCTQGRVVLCNGRANAPRGLLYDGTARIHLNGTPVNQMARIGTFSEYVVCGAEQVVPVRKDLPWAHAAIIGCSVATGVGAVTRHAQVPAGSTVAVIGCGGVGLNIVQGARLAGARQIIAIDLLDNKLGYAKTFGATHTINAKKDDVLKAVKDITGGAGVEFSFDAIGSEVTAQQALEVCGVAGHATLVGIPAVQTKATYSPFMLVFTEKKLTGSYYGSVRPRLDFPILADLSMSKQLDLDSMISRTYRFDEINDGFKNLAEGTVARGVIMM
jgi:S-(hydroxymethyl)glutathione dehydrogenase / alcohol dehydrogenase